MSSIMKVFLLLAVMVCISQAQFHQSGKQCLCNRVRRPLGFKSEIKDIQIYRATIFCDKVEIVVTNNNGFRYCLDPKLSAVKKLLAKIMSREKTSTPAPTEVSSTAGSTNTARI